MKFEEAIQKIQYGKCLLLTGAGFSLGAKNYKQDKSAFRIAKYIAHELYNECDVPKGNQDDDLRRASQWYIRQYGEDKIIAFLQREFIIKEISPTQKELGNFPWRRCYTLNYDEILERAYLENNKLLSSVTLSDESEQYRTSSVCVHLNGVISQLSRATIDNSFKLTYKSYNKRELFRLKFYLLLIVGVGVLAFLNQVHLYYVILPIYFFLFRIGSYSMRKIL